VPRSLLVAGDLVEDVVVWPDAPVQRGTDTPARVFRSRGGSAANVAVAAAGLVATRFVGCVGPDAVGDRLVAQLQAAGVDTRVQRHGHTGTVVVLVDVDGERTFLPDRGASAQLGPVPADALDDVAVLHVPAYGLHGGRTADSLRDLLERAVGCGVPVSLDASSWAVLRSLGVAQVRSLVQQLRPAVLFANADEARELDLAAHPLPVTVVVKDGPRPTVVHSPDGTSTAVEVAPVDGVRDSTGAGDAFAAGWLSAMMDGLDVRARVLRAHDLARRVLLHPGAATAEENP
jgi:sugar/nucleoside kinase (ribokinase family)